MRAWFLIVILGLIAIGGAAVFIRWSSGGDCFMFCHSQLGYCMDVKTKFGVLEPKDCRWNFDVCRQRCE